MRIRRALSDDFPVIHELLNQLMRGLEHRRLAMWSMLMAHQGYAAWIAEVDDTPAGFVDLFVFPDVAHGENIGIVSNLIVDERFRGAGLSETLLGEAVEHARREQAMEVHVWIDFDNTRAIGLCKKVGFIERALLQAPSGHLMAPDQEESRLR